MLSPSSAHLPSLSATLSPRERRLLELRVIVIRGLDERACFELAELLLFSNFH